MDVPGITVTEADNKIFLQVRPDDERPVVDDAMLRVLLADFGAGACVLDDEALAKAAEDCNMRDAPFVVQVAQRVDASFSIRVAKDDMLAEVCITQARGGKSATVDDLVQALTKAGVVAGTDPAQLAQAVQRTDGAWSVVAQGTLPENGLDVRFEELIVHTANRTPKVNDSGMIDYREHGNIDVVTPGTALMRRHPATPGKDGQTVRARVLSARPGHDAPFAPALTGTATAQDDPNLLQANVTGQPVLVERGVMVEQVLTVAEVNMASGNIHFDGSVQVKGDVVQGMKIEASGDIMVGGMVDGGFLHAGGDIHVTGGVIAHATLIAGGAVSARFAQDVKIRSGTVLSLADMALECELESFNQIVIGAQSKGRGRLVGGKATAMMLLSVPILGSSKASLTRVVVGANAELTERYEALEKLLEKEKADEEALEKLLKQVTAAKDPKGLLPRIQASRQHAMQVWGQSLMDKKALEQEIAHEQEARIEVSVGVEGSVDLVFGTQTARLRKEFAAGSFALEPTEMVIMFNDGTASRPAQS